MNSGNVVWEGGRDILCWEEHTLSGWIRRQDSKKFIKMILENLACTFTSPILFGNTYPKVLFSKHPR